MHVNVDQSSIEQKETGIASIVYQARLNRNLDCLIAIKSSSSRRTFSPEPHDILKEIAILSDISHSNIIQVAGSRSTGDTIELWTPWIPYNLEHLLDSPTFSPNHLPSEIRHLILSSANGLGTPSRADIFKVVTKSVAYQLILALEYLHGLNPPIAHRDIKPRNVLLASSGCVKLIDFGIAFHERVSADLSNLWPETAGNMYNDVATGPFRAPELLFGPKTYDACATDLWSLGCTLAHFFTPIRLLRKSYYDDEDDEDDPGPVDENDAQCCSGYLLPKDMDAITFRSAKWMRMPLFDGRRGSIGLAWSIFRLRGTPNAENWPDFELLPDANKVQFKVVPTVDMCPRLPNLPSETKSTGSTHAPPLVRTPSALDLIHRLLVYPPGDRLAATNARRHPWLISEDEVPLVLPADYISAEESATSAECPWHTMWHERELEHWLSEALKGSDK